MARVAFLDDPWCNRGATCVEMIEEMDKIDKFNRHRW